jgi:hypothetical protein
VQATYARGVVTRIGCFRVFPGANWGGYPQPYIFSGSLKAAKPYVARCRLGYTQQHQPSVDEIFSREYLQRLPTEIEGQGAQARGGQPSLGGGKKIFF